MALLAILPAIVFQAGCRTTAPCEPGPAKPLASPNASQYHLKSFKWENVARVLVLPVHNESIYNRVDIEVQQALAAELQRLGRFEVVSLPCDCPAIQAATIHISGRFDEGAMLELGRTFAADVVIHATVTQYMPYGRARIGLVVQAVSPLEAKVIASVDGLWDTASIEVATRAREYYRAPINARGPVMAAIKNALAAPTEDGRADELAIESPSLFQRFVCNEVVQNLVVLPEDPARLGYRMPPGSFGASGPCRDANAPCGPVAPANSTQNNCEPWMPNSTPKGDQPAASNAASPPPSTTAAPGSNIEIPNPAPSTGPTVPNSPRPGAKIAPDGPE